MKANVSTILFVIFALLFTACDNLNLNTQKIKSKQDCITCNGWSWSNGVATAGEGDSESFQYWERSFSFEATISGELTLGFKVNSPDYLSWVVAWINGKTKCSVQYTKSKQYQKISLGHVAAGNVVYITGVNVIVKNVIITGTIDDTNNPDDTPHWDF